MLAIAKSSQDYADKRLETLIVKGLDGGLIDWELAHDLLKIIRAPQIQQGNVVSIRSGLSEPQYQALWLVLSDHLECVTDFAGSRAEQEARFVETFDIEGQNFCSLLQSIFQSVEDELGFTDT